MNGMHTIDPAQVTVQVGPYFIDGFGDGQMIKWAPDADWWAKKVGGDGDVTRILTNDFTGMVTLTLDSASDSNDKLTTLALIDRHTKAGTVPVQIKDLMGRTLIATSAAWVKKPTDFNVEKGKSPDREWILDCGQMEGLFIGGN